MTDNAVRDAVLGAIDGGQASMTFDQAVANFPPAHYNTKPANVPYSFWHLLEHIRITARDILDYARSADYLELSWPGDYWPPRDAVTDEAGWNATIEAIYRDMADLRALVASPGSDISALALNAGDNTGHTIVREVLVVIDHNAYHTGEFAILRQVEGLWPEGHE